MLKKIKNIFGITGFVFVMLGAWFFSIIFKTVVPEMTLEGIRNEWIEKQHISELNTSVYETTKYETVDGIKFDIVNVEEQDDLLIMDINVDTTGYLHQLSNEVLDQEYVLGTLSFLVVPDNIDYKEEEFNKELINENRNSSYPLTLKLGKLTVNPEDTKFGIYVPTSEYAVSGKRYYEQGHIYANDIRSYRIIILNPRVNVLIIAMNYSYKLTNISSTYSYMVTKPQYNNLPPL